MKDMRLPCFQGKLPTPVSSASRVRGIFKSMSAAIDGLHAPPCGGNRCAARWHAPQSGQGQDNMNTRGDRQASVSITHEENRRICVHSGEGARFMERRSRACRAWAVAQEQPPPDALTVGQACGHIHNTLSTPEKLTQLECLHTSGWAELDANRATM